MAATFRHSVRLADAKPLRDGLAAIFVDGGDPRLVIDVRRVLLRQPSTFTSTTTPVLLDLVRCSDASGGELTTPIKFDTSASNMPSQVEARMMPDSVTATVTYRNIVDTHGLATSTGGTGARIPGNFRNASPMNQCHLVGKIRGSSSVEPIVLREGEGVALVMEPNTGGLSRAMRARVTVRVLSTGSCYRYTLNDIATPAMVGGVFSLMNNTGSGVVLEVVQIEFPPEGDSSVIPRIQLAYIDGFETSVQPVSGENFVPTQAPIAFDSKSFLPPQVKCVGAGFISMKRGARYGFPQDWWYAQGSVLSLAAQQRGGRVRGRIFQMPVRGSTSGNFGHADMTDGVRLFEAGDAFDGLLLRPGEGLAVCCGDNGNLDNSAYSSYDIYMDFVVRYDARGSKGGMTYVG